MDTLKNPEIVWESKNGLCRIVRHSWKNLEPTAPGRLHGHSHSDSNLSVEYTDKVDALGNKIWEDGHGLIEEYLKEYLDTPPQPSRSDEVLAAIAAVFKDMMTLDNPARQLVERLTIRSNGSFVVRDRDARVVYDSEIG